MTGLIAKVAAFPPPVWGRDREGGNHYRYKPGRSLTD
jgi:hypothetical protein